MKPKHLVVLVFMMIAVVLLFAADVIYGSINIPIKDIVSILSGTDNQKESWKIIILDSRLPKAITAVICGFALSLSGLQMQTLFRNPLAGPYILGISSGAGLGVALLTLGVQLSGFQPAALMENWSIVAASIAGSTLVMLLIFWASLRVKDIMTVLILGVMLAAIINAIIGIFQFFSNADELKSFIVWTFGSLDGVSMKELTILSPLVLLTSLFVFFTSKSLNLMLLGDHYAKSMGMRIQLSRTGIVVSTSVLAGTVTAYCGPIGFIGIVVPHLCRLLFKTSDHRMLIPASALMGAIFMLFSDIISHLPGSDGILPLNSVTAILGIPFIIWMVFGKKAISTSF